MDYKMALEPVGNSSINSLFLYLRMRNHKRLFKAKLPPLSYCLRPKRYTENLARRDLGLYKSLRL